jgi:DNA-binding response OmpR family regulator
VPHRRSPGVPEMTDAAPPRRRSVRQPHVLVVEDQAALAHLIERVLGEEGFRTTLAFDGRTGLQVALGTAPEAMVLDVSLPGLDGLELCRAVRARGLRMPIIMLTARDAVPDRVAGLEAGADDYVTKPFAFEELIARLRAHLRREGRTVGPLQVADLVLDPETHRVTRNGHEVALSAQEFRLLELLIRHVGQVLTRDRILEHIWGYDAEPSSNVVDVYMHYLRRKVDHGFETPLIHTVRAVGYVLRA